MYVCKSYVGIYWEQGRMLLVLNRESHFKCDGTMHHTFGKKQFAFFQLLSVNQHAQTFPYETSLCCKQHGQ
jgi:hypothetical protein